MTDKENARRIISFDNPERVMSWPPCRYISYHGANHQGFDDPVTMTDGHTRPVGTSWRDIFQTGWMKEQADVMGMPRFHPISRPDMLKDYTWPDPDDPRICEKIYNKVAEFGRSPDYFLAGSHRETLWEKAYMLVGMENMMTYFYTEPGFAREILHRVMDFQLGIARHHLNAGIELVNMGDDLGTQRGLLLSPGIIEDFLLPEYRRLFSLYKENHVIIWFHSCGHIEAAIRYFIDLGVDILNPVQANANDLKTVRELTDGKMALHGAIPTAVIMDGPVDRIERTVRDTLRLMGKNGGYFCAADQCMPFPEAHSRAFEDALEKYGKYPIL